MAERTIEEWGQVRNDALAALTWVNACAGQILRWQDASLGAHDGGEVDWVALDQAYTEGFFLAIAADQLRLSLEAGVHADLLGLLPRPDHVEGLPGEAFTGAEYVRHVRNAHYYKDEHGRFSRDYGYGHGWHVGSANDVRGSNVGGIALGPFLDALMDMEAELTRRREEAAAEFDRLLAVRRAQALEQDGEATTRSS